MAQAKETKKTSATATTASVDKVGFCVVITTVVIIFIVVVSGVCVRFLLEESLSRIILIALICFLCLLGMLVLFILEVRRRKYAKTSSTVRAVTLRNGTYNSVQPSAPQDTSWEYTNRATAQA